MFVVSVRFEADETSADKDQHTFSNLVKCINIPLTSNYPQSLVISTNDVHPGWTVAFFLERLLDVISTCEGRSLLLLHYAGHGGLNGATLSSANITLLSMAIGILRCTCTLMTLSHLVISYVILWICLYDRNHRGYSSDLMIRNF